MLDKVGLGKINMLSSTDIKAAPAMGGTEIGEQFGHIFNNELSKIQEQGNIVNSLNEKFAAGELTDIHQLLIASQKSTIGLELTVQVRNKVIEAYQEIMRTQI